MAIAKEQAAQDSHMALLQECSLYGAGGEGPPPSQGLFEEGESSDDTSGSDSVKNFSFSPLPSLSNSAGFLFGNTRNSLPDEAQSVINFKSTGYGSWGRPNESLLSFDQGDRIYSIWADSMDKNNMWNHLNPKCSDESRLSEDPNCFEMASGCSFTNTNSKHLQLGEEGIGWLYSGADDGAESLQQSGGPKTCSYKRPFMGDDMQGMKRQCTGVPRKSKTKSGPSKDPQSIAAKNRRERISERLKILQDLVPNGAKVDLVTMLEKAISYVKFLQLQVKVLAMDEFWPAQGGKAPQVSQVKEAIDAILTSHKDRNSSSSSK
ncbi:hypothetical protein NE237_020336 [Protea cynaroides]|uniref:BHLH domain-containing protein n=1 Tax=Protea cynaroides TaxID=273540 RepID=A0A9Q0H5S6_9MAGN|nr:hypothetical protein NE237_020336 [Protea cynaroides]